MAKKPNILTEKFEDFSNKIDWRWSRVLALYGDESSPVPGFDDKYIVRAYKYIRAFESAGNLSEKQLLRMKYPHEQRAYDYYLNADSRKLTLESLCLCEDLTRAEIADILDEDESTVEFYEKIFFDVRNRKRSALLHLLFPPGSFETVLGQNGRMTELVWKFIAFGGGYKFLRCLMNPHELDVASDEFFATIGKRNAMKNFGIASLVQPIDNTEDITSISETVLRLLELEVKEKELSGNALPEAQSAILKKCIEATNVQVLDPDTKLDSPYELSIDEKLNRTIQELDTSGQ
jgi:hypothetical protein